MGAKVHYPYDETAYLEAPAIEDISQIDSLSRQIRIKTVICRTTLSYENSCGHSRKRSNCNRCVTCPFTNASFLVGAEKLVRLILRDPKRCISCVRSL
jgi:uroporphyrinogen decarboxylase